MKKVIVHSNKYGNHYSRVDDEDFELVKQYNWTLHKNSNLYAKRVIKKDKKSIIILMHQLILPNSKCIDHIDGDGLNNQKYNLRICSVKENSRNKKKKLNCTSKYKGVYWDKTRNKWTARIKVNYKGIFLGRYLDEKEAAKAYNNAAIKYFKEFAKLNKIG